MANGLVPGITLAALAVFFIEYSRPMDGVLLFACSMFFIINVISGGYFLGNTGSYGLGAILLGYDLMAIFPRNYGRLVLLPPAWIF